MITIAAVSGASSSALARGLVAIALVGAAIAGLGASVPQADAAESVAGRWSSPFWEGGDSAYDPPSRENARKYPTAAAATVLPDSRMLYWNGLEGVDDGDVWMYGSDGRTVVENARVRILDLRSGRPVWSTSALERGTTDDGQRGAATLDLFCSDHKLLYNGQVLVAGGSRWDVAEDTKFAEPRGLTATRLFDPAEDAFRSVDDMREPRWYPSLVTLADGRVAVASGLRRSWVDRPDTAFNQVRLTEVYDPAAERWQDAGLSDWSFPLYPRLHLLPDGKVFYGGAGQSWNPFGETADEATWGLQRLYDPVTERWTVLGHSRYGVRSGAASVMLRLEPPYERADILVAGGSLGATPGTWAATTLSELVRWTPRGVSNVGSPKAPLGGMAGDRSQLRKRRWFGTPVMLPTGEVLLVNGGDSDDALNPGSSGAVRTPELYDPRSRTWKELAPASRDRIYHNSAVLLRDGRVLVGGNAPHPAHFLRYDNTLSRNNNFRDSTFEIYEPPYLFRGRRPVVRHVRPGRKNHRLRLTLGRRTPAESVSEIVLVRMGANTHSMDADMRAVKLRHSGSGRRVVAHLPLSGDGRILPPGPYFVFAIRESADGPVPSVAKVVMIRPRSEGQVVARRP